MKTAANARTLMNSLFIVGPGKDDLGNAVHLLYSYGAPSKINNSGYDSSQSEDKCHQTLTRTSTHVLIQQIWQIHVVTISNALVLNVNQSLSSVSRGATCRERTTMIQ